MRAIAMALAIVGALSAAPAVAATDAAAPGRHEDPQTSIHEKFDTRANHGAIQPAPPAMERNRRPYGHRPHRIIFVYVPAYASVGVPYYPYFYSPAAPAYVEQDPPDYAYREPNGFYYWCPDPAGYYPDQQDCPIGWRLVAP